MDFRIAIVNEASHDGKVLLQESCNLPKTGSYWEAVSRFAKFLETTELMVHEKLVMNEQKPQRPSFH